MNLDLPPPTLVAEARGLEQLVGELTHAREIAVDTEADSFFNFREKVCLLQITAGERDWLIDPLAGLAEPAHTGLRRSGAHQVFHGEYDILILKRDYGLSCQPVRHARRRRCAGRRKPQPAAVLKTGIESTSLQRSN